MPTVRPARSVRSASLSKYARTMRDRLPFALLYRFGTQLNRMALRAGLIGGQGDRQRGASILATHRQRPAFKHRGGEPLHHADAALGIRMGLADLMPDPWRHAGDVPGRVDAQRVTLHHLPGAAIDEVPHIGGHAITVDAGAPFDRADGAIVITYSDERQILDLDRRDECAVLSV